MYTKDKRTKAPVRAGRPRLDQLPKKFEEADPEEVEIIDRIVMPPVCNDPSGWKSLSHLKNATIMYLMGHMPYVAQRLVYIAYRAQPKDAMKAIDTILGLLHMTASKMTIEHQGGSISAEDAERLQKELIRIVSTQTGPAPGGPPAPAPEPEPEKMEAVAVASA